MTYQRRSLLTVMLVALVCGVVALTANSAADTEPPAAAGTDGIALATFAGGCFWCMEGPFDELPGVISTTSGYTGGHTENPSYKQVSAGGTGHAEAVQVAYDPARISYPELLRVFWRNIDPTTPDRQFCDRGNQYRPEIFVHDEAQRAEAEASLAEVERNKTFSAPIRTPVTTASRFWPAEDYHQDYYVKNPLRYRFYRFNCGRDQRLEELWGTGAAH